MCPFSPPPQALLINGGASPLSLSIHLSELNISASGASVQDVWSGAQLGKTGADGSFTTPVVNGTDSARSPPLEYP